MASSHVRRRKRKKSIAPWRKYTQQHPGVIPDESVLRGWRKVARKLAKSIGARTSCDLCKRPVNRYGYVWLRTPNAWRVKALKRVICSSCWEALYFLIAQMETEGHRENLPIEGAAVTAADASSIDVAMDPSGKYINTQDATSPEPVALLPI